MGLATSNTAATLVSLFFLAILSVARSSSDGSFDEGHGDDGGFADLVAWMKAHGGRVDPRFGLTTFPDLGGIRGAVALDNIGEGTELLHCPWSLVVGSDSMHGTPDSCDVARTIEAELRLGEDSLWHRYLQMDDSLNSRIPNVWDESARSELQGLPPYDATRHVDWYTHYCVNGLPFEDLDNVSKQAMLAVVTRACDRGMVPIYDLINHHNGLLNTRIAVTEKGFQIIATVSIGKGEQIYNTYGSGTADLFRDYGFVEPWPQVWRWKDPGKSDMHSFVLFPDGVAAIEPTNSFLSDIGRGYTPLEDYLVRVEQHNSNVISLNQLGRFVAAANALLFARSTVDDDSNIVNELRNQLKKLSDTAGVCQDGNEPACGPFRLLEDRIRAIEYRMTFKRAVQDALSRANEVLLDRQGEAASRQEL